MEKQTLKLRPHHIQFLKTYTDNSRDEHNRLRNRALLFYVYGEEYAKKLDEFAKMVTDGREVDVEIVEGLEEICSDCQFNNNCRNRDFYDVTRRYKEAVKGIYGFDFDGNVNPEAEDLVYLRYLKLEVGKTYNLRELLSKPKS